jgi:hypothetical protein
VLVAVLAVRMMQVVAHQVVDVVAMRHSLMAAAIAMGVFGLVALTVVLGRAVVRVRGVHRDDVLVDVVAVGMVEVSLVQVIDVVAVLDGRVAAAGPMLVRVI